MAGAIAITIALPVLTKDKHSAGYVFGTVEDGSGWHNKGFSFLIGYLSVAWTMTDYDATAHLSEELHNAAISGPVAIFEAILITWVSRQSGHHIFRANEDRSLVGCSMLLTDSALATFSKPFPHLLETQLLKYITMLAERVAAWQCGSGQF